MVVEQPRRLPDCRLMVQPEAQLTAAATAGAKVLLLCRRASVWFWHSFGPGWKLHSQHCLAPLSDAASRSTRSTATPHSEMLQQADWRAVAP